MKIKKIIGLLSLMIICLTVNVFGFDITIEPGTTTYKQGRYKVGEDITAGEYLLINTGFLASCIVTTGSTGEDLILEDIFETTLIITVSDNQYLIIEDCKAIPFDDAPNYTDGQTELIRGMYKVGLHIPPGKYTLNADIEEGYYAIHADSTLINKISGDFFTYSTSIEVKENEYLILGECVLLLNEESGVLSESLDKTSSLTVNKSNNTFNAYDNSEQQNTTAFVLNKSTKKFHKSSCAEVKKIKSSNYATDTNRDDIINKGYVPCKKCNP